MSRPASPRWRGHCTGCNRDGVLVESRRAHHERVLCDRCGARPAPRSLIDPADAARARAELDAEKAADPRPGLAVDPADLDRWEAERQAGIAARARHRNADALDPRTFAAMRRELGRVYARHGFPIIDPDGDELLPCPCCDGRPDVSAAPLMLHVRERRITCSTGCDPRQVAAALLELIGGVDA